VISCLPVPANGPDLRRGRSATRPASWRRSGTDRQPVVPSKDGSETATGSARPTGAPPRDVPSRDTRTWNYVGKTSPPSASRFSTWSTGALAVTVRRRRLYLSERSPRCPRLVPLRRSRRRQPQRAGTPEQCRDANPCAAHRLARPRGLAGSPPPRRNDARLTRTQHTEARQTCQLIASPTPKGTWSSAPAATAESGSGPPGTPNSVKRLPPRRPDGSPGPARPPGWNLEVAARRSETRS